MSRDRYRPRTFTRTPQQERVSWAKLVEAARLVAERARGTTFGEGAGDPRRLIDDLRHLRVGLQAQGFPIAHASMRMIAGAFLSLVDAFGLASPETRAEYAPALRETAAILWRALEDQRAVEAEAWKRQLPASERV